MNLDKMKEIWDLIIKVLFVIAVIATIILTWSVSFRRTSPPIEENRIDSLNKVNAKIIIEVEHLDSIKDAKVIEVKSLDNDSTLRLFYQLVSK